ncbi:UDP-N-acetylmuramate dehydrogenase [Altibacter sp. HG106]|uniref:UDP-N-acetylmuramate dehydrogenase n=1 Tax=Altibacter sp. HG106 TaxID=3023937 RepID=UPI00234FFB1D|nr:UDP-N-acetylmuramate dehydrogenase [Altibacter sp. HG106]MDC7995849.1 UDP-N-acetylmuramate dehydrogenase [Altibacter sp. HG106]
MQIEEHYSLRNHNTFGIAVEARFFVSVNSVSELKEALASPIHPKKFILGGGSNMLLTQDVDALVIHVNIRGIETCSEDETTVTVKAMAGENWHEFVLYTLDQGWGGLENLSLIPGNVGTAPIQNIGAYGVELKDRMVSCNAVAVIDGTEREFSVSDCEFGYRNSIFKNRLKGRYVITEVVFRLTKTAHELHTEYGAIREQLATNKVSNIAPKHISEAVIAIRRQKLPDPKELGNSGSFFKNPVISKAAFDRFQRLFPEAPYYNVSDTEVKIPAGWLIEQAGFKGKRFGDAGVHKHQALVLVNHGNATGEQLWTLAENIQAAVKEQFGIEIVPEVNVL